MMKKEGLKQVVTYVEPQVKQSLADTLKRLPMRTSESSYVAAVLRKHFERKGANRANERRTA